MHPDSVTVPPGGTIGIVGGGQLGRMTALAAAAMGYRCHVLCPEAESPAVDVCAAATIGPYDDPEILARFAASVDVVTYEFENLPIDSFELMAGHAPVRPHWRCLEITQHRATEKDFVTGLGMGTAPWRKVRDAGELDAALQDLGRPAILKTVRMGYDGKGQVGIGPDTPAGEAWAALDRDEGILEGVVDFECEISAIVARTVDGTTALFDITENVHRDGILAESRAPAAIPGDLAEQAAETARRIADAFELAGLLAVEMFVTRDGRILVNELAARPHNSGHWTIDACRTSQFEQFVRAVAGLPLGDPSRHADAVMVNLLGDDIGTWAAIVGEPAARLHLYGKTQSRPGRKMGHVTRLSPRSRA